MCAQGGPLRLAVLISGSGRTLQNFIELCREGRLPARIAIVVSSKRSVLGVQRARDSGLPVEVVARKDHATPESFSDAISGVLDRYEPDLILLAGFLSLYRIPPRYEGRVMNIHPALLPAFGGAGMHGHKVHEAVLASGARESGCTVHFADNEFDHGPAILQRRVPVLAGDTPDTLAERVFQEELKAYPEAVRLYAEGGLRRPMQGRHAE